MASGSKKDDVSDYLERMILTPQEMKEMKEEMKEMKEALKEVQAQEIQERKEALQDMIQEMTDLYDYLRMFKGDMEFFKHVRVVFTGREGAGKTTTCERLQYKDVDLNNREPTVGSVLHPNWFLIDDHSKEWIQNDDKSGSEILELRLGTMLKKAATKRKSNEDDSMIEDLEGKYLEESKAVQQASRSVNINGALLSLWDMGGHSSFQASHNVFISSHGVYLLVFRLTDFLTDKLETDRLKKWIRIIGTFSSVELNAPKLKEHEPPLIFVGTFLDELKKTSKDYETQVKAIRFSIAEFPELYSHKFVRFCTLDNSEGKKRSKRNESLRRLRETIIELAEHQDQWGRKLPAKWLKFEMDLLKLREIGNKILTLAEVIAMNKASLAPMEDEEIILALEYLHSTRSVIYFREFEYVINDPQWLADFFSLLITDDQFLPEDDLHLARDLDLYKEKGELTPGLVDGLLGLQQNKDFLPHKSILLALMEKFGLVVRIRISDPTVEECFSDRYTVPSKLMELGQVNIGDITDKISDLKQINLAVSKTLCVIFQDIFVPEELFHRVFAKIMKTYKTALLSSRQLEDKAGKNSPPTDLYKGFGCFEVNDLCRMIVSMHWERSTIAMTLFSPSEDKVPRNLGTDVRNTLEKILEETLQMSSQQHFRYTHRLHCNFHISPYDTPVEIYSIINARGGMSCKGEECRGQHRLKNSDLLFWGITKVNENVQDSVYSEEATCLDRRPTPAELSRLSYEVEASKCQQLFVFLGLSMPEISNTEHETRNFAAVTQITRLFLKWTYTYPNETFRHIERAMKEVEMATNNLGNVVDTGWECVTLDGMESYEENLDRPLTTDKIQALVDKIGKDYFNLFLQLGLSVSTTEKCEMEHGDVKRRVETLIKLWINKFQNQATVIRFVKEMKLCKMDWYSAARAYCDADETETETQKCQETETETQKYQETETETQKCLCFPSRRCTIM